VTKYVTTPRRLLFITKDGYSIAVEMGANIMAAIYVMDTLLPLQQKLLLAFLLGVAHFRLFRERQVPTVHLPTSPSLMFVRLPLCTKQRSLNVLA
jgi:hypothetical protein